MSNQNKITYVELPARDIPATKAFFTSVFGWAFIDYGPDYATFTGAGLDGGFFKSDLNASTDTGSALVVIYREDLEYSLETVKKEGGSIIKPIFDFPGGRRFHFGDPNGNELAVWSDKQPGPARENSDRGH